MVIQANMSSKAISEVWEHTLEVFNRFNVPITEMTLQELVNDNILHVLLMELNHAVDSNNATCIEGG